MYNGIIFLDYDGTIIHKKYNILKPTDETLKTINRFKNLGYLVVINTGRQYKDIKDHINFTDFFISSGGSYIRNKDEIIFNKLVDQTVLINIANYLDSINANYIIEDYQHLYIKNIDDKIVDLLNFNNVDLSMVRKIDNLDSIECNKLSIIKDEFDINQFNSLFDNFKIVKQLCSGVYDVFQNDVDKGTAIDTVIKYTNISFENSFAFGDGLIDIPMMDKVKYGVAMSNSVEELKAVANYITESVKNDGIANFLKDF